MKITDKTYGEERALYGEPDIELESCRFEGEEDGESALKECGAVKAKDCRFDLRYPLWHDRSVELNNCELTKNCRAALWYSTNINIRNSKLHGIKAVRECNNVTISGSDIDSPEFGWSTSRLEFYDTAAVSEYFCLRASGIKAKKLSFKGKYSFQYIENAEFDGCTFDTKDAFWHSKNVTVKNSRVGGEYLGWYSDRLTLINCIITGTQPLCYCKRLTLIDCYVDGDLAFERSQVNASLCGEVISIKNPYKGDIIVPKAGEIIRDDKNSKARIIIDPLRAKKRPGE